MANQEEMRFEEDNKIIKSVESFQFEPIKGYPMLNWKGKRPFRSTQFYPAQLKERYGNEVNDWMNELYWGDNIQVMSHLLKKFRGKIQLIYIDPPFDSKADYKKTISIKSNKVSNDYNVFEEKQYTDIWTNDDYLQFMYERLVLMKELLGNTGVIYLHCDNKKVHHLRSILDEIFGPQNFVNEIIWCYTGASQTKSKFIQKHDNILVYKKNSDAIFNWEDVLIPYSEETEARTGRGAGGSGLYTSSEAEDKHKNRLKKGGKIPEDWWIDIFRLQGNGNENLQYPTQKPEKLLERIIKASSNPGDIIFDCFMGSGTTQAVAMKHGRRFIGADINLGSIQTSTKRLLNIIEHQKQPQITLDTEHEISYCNFQVFNVNNYDVFKNPIQGKDLLIEALEIQPLDRNTIFDGEKDGRMVKIMPINRIATRADLNDLITGLDYRTYEKRKEERPNQPVEKITLVCMGHEPDLAATLQNEIDYKLDINVVDILRDKSQLEFKRDSEAKISTIDYTLIIDQFYPMNLLQKLSLLQENVINWKELVESIMIDWNYDGVIFEPSVVDVPEKNEFVKGVYPIPKECGTIRVKITDLLSESLEVNIKHG